MAAAPDHGYGNSSKLAKGSVSKSELRTSKIKTTLQELGFFIKYVPDSVIGEHVACYYVRYKGRQIRPRPAIKMGIPLNQI